MSSPLLKHGTARTVEEEERSRIRINFRKNVEIFDGKIQHGETMSDVMPMLSGPQWEDRTLFSLILSCQ